MRIDKACLCCGQAITTWKLERDTDGQPIDDGHPYFCGGGEADYTEWCQCGAMMEALNRSFLYRVFHPCPECHGCLCPVRLAGGEK